MDRDTPYTRGGVSPVRILVSVQSQYLDPMRVGDSSNSQHSSFTIKYESRELSRN